MTDEEYDIVIQEIREDATLKERERILNILRIEAQSSSVDGRAKFLLYEVIRHINSE
jgi:hypothetical protein